MMIDFGIGFLCGFAVMFAIHMVNRQLTAQNISNTTGSPVVKSRPTPPNNLLARQNRTVRHMQEMEESITKGATEYYG